MCFYRLLDYLRTRWVLDIRAVPGDAEVLIFKEVNCSLHCRGFSVILRTGMIKNTVQGEYKSYKIIYLVVNSTVNCFFFQEGFKWVVVIKIPL